MLNKIKKIKLSKSKYIYTVIAGLIIIAIGFTFAWWRWSSEINAIVNGQVCAPEIVFVGGSTINGHDLLPVRTKEEGLTKDINVNLNNTCDNDTAVLNLNLKPDVFPEGLADSSFKWSLYQVTTEEVNNEPVETLTYVSDGNFNGKRQYVNDNDLISIATDLIVTENISTYRLYIWIDGTMDNPSAIGDNSFRFKLYGTGSGAIYNQYTMKQVSNSAATSSFWGSPINANQVKSISFIPTDQVSGEWTNTYDLSSLANSNDVTMYYVENGATTGDNPITLYDVYVASNNGTSKIKTNTTTSSMFGYLSNCEYIDAEGLDTSNSTSMQFMFFQDAKLKTLKISNWDTSNVKTMQNMFYGCSSLEELDLSNLNTSSVENMLQMFRGCSKLKEINVNNFNTSQVTTMASMFYGCSGLSSLNLDSFDTSNVTTMASMFQNAGTSDLIIDIDNFNTPKVTTMASMFYGCNAKSISLSNFSNDKLTNMSSMFNSSKASSIKLDNFNTSSVTTMQQMFMNCSNLTEVDLSSFNTRSVSTMRGMFYNCSKLKSLDLSNFYTDSLTTINYGGAEGMFGACTALEELDLSNFDTSKVTDMRVVFYNCRSLRILKLDNWDFSNVTNYTYAFALVPSSVEVIVKDCEQYSNFRTKFGSSYTNLHTVNNDSCTA